MFNMRKLTLEEIKQREVVMLNFFDEYCKKNGLKYYLCGGTLLGAVRHKGFIPWDDDLDVCMPRRDYQKLNRIFQENGKFVLYSDLNRKSARPYARLYDVNTTAESKYVEKEGRPHLWLDILPVDGLPENEVELKYVYKKSEFYQKIMVLKTAKAREGKNLVRRMIKPFPIFISKLYGAQWALDKMYSLMRKYPYESAKYVGVLTAGIYGVGERMEKMKFEKTVMVEFEGHQYPTFSCWKEYLTGIYGDYMQLPPVEKRKTHELEVYVNE